MLFHRGGYYDWFVKKKKIRKTAVEMCCWVVGSFSDIAVVARRCQKKKKHENSRKNCKCKNKIKKIK